MSDDRHDIKREKATIGGIPVEVEVDSDGKMLLTTLGNALVYGLHNQGHANCINPAHVEMKDEQPLTYPRAEDDEGEKHPMDGTVLVAPDGRIAIVHDRALAAVVRPETATRLLTQGWAVDNEKEFWAPLSADDLPTPDDLARALAESATATDTGAVQ